MTRGKMRAKQKTVLFIDDESPWLEMIKEAVNGESINIMTADSGEAALRQLQKKKPDLIMSDVRMPAMNGFDLFEKVRSDPKFRNVPYVFMSSIDDFDARRTAKELGADDYVEKPIDTEEVRHIVLSLLTRFKQNKHDIGGTR
jgi:YesN/AraC family two-component response regulator